MKKFIVLLGLLALTGSAFGAPADLTFVAFQPGGWQVGYAYTVDVDGTLRQ